MKVVRIEILSAQDGVTERATLKVERQEQDAWKEDASYGMITGDPTGVRQIMIDDNQRIIIEGSSAYELVFDKEQMATVRRPRDEKAQEQERQLAEERAVRQKMIFDREKEDREAADAQTMADAPPKTNLGNPVENPPPKEPPTPPVVPPPSGAPQEPQPTSPMGKVTPQSPSQSAGTQAPGGARSSVEVKK